MNEKFPLALPKGTILAGQYVIDRVLGQGGFGITYEAEDCNTKQKVAVKEFFPDSMAGRTNTIVTAFSGERGESFAYGKTCFLEEAKTLAQFIGNENIVRVHTYFEENGTAYFVMDFVEGTSFDAYIKDQGGKISYEEAEKILLPVIDALAAVHSKGIIHRDVTPDNIYITKEGTVKLLDFGAARYSLGDKSRSLDVVLKHGFAPKEQYTRHGRQGPYTDVYTVGASFYYAITGKRPPDSIDRMEEDELIPPSSLGVRIPREKEDAILKAMSIQPSDRYQNMGEFKMALMGITTAAMPAPTVAVGGQNRIDFTAPIPPSQIPPSQIPSSQIQPSQMPVSPQQPKKKNKWIIPVAISAGAVIVIALVIAVVVIVGNSRKRDTSGEPVAEDNDVFSDSPVTQNKLSIGDISSVKGEEESEEEQVVTGSRKIIGSTPNNIANYGQFLIEEDDLLFCYPGGNGLALVNDSGTVWLDDSGYVRCLSVVGDQIYYINTGDAYVVNRDGTNKKKIPELSEIDTIANLWVTESGYFIYKNDDSGLCFINSSTGKREGYINCINSRAVTFWGDYVYYVKETQFGSQMCRLPANDLSADPEKMLNAGEIGECYQILVDDDYLYGWYEEDDSYCIFTYDLQNDEIVYRTNLEMDNGWEGTITAMNVFDGYVYLSFRETDSSGVDTCSVYSVGVGPDHGDDTGVYNEYIGDSGDYYSWIIVFSSGEFVLNGYDIAYDDFVILGEMLGYGDGTEEPVVLKETDLYSE